MYLNSIFIVLSFCVLYSSIYIYVMLWDGVNDSVSCVPNTLNVFCNPSPQCKCGTYLQFNTKCNDLVKPIFSNTDTTIIFLFREMSPLSIGNKFSSRIELEEIYPKIGFLCFYLTLAFDKFLDIQFIRRELQCKRICICLYGAHKFSRRLARHKRVLQVHLKFFFFSYV